MAISNSKRREARLKEDNEPDSINQIYSTDLGYTNVTSGGVNPLLSVTRLYETAEVTSNKIRKKKD